MNLVDGMVFDFGSLESLGLNSGDPSCIHVALLITFIGIGRFSFFSSALERAGGVDRTFARNRFALIV